MLSAEKHLNLDTSVIRVAAIILRELGRKGVVEFERLRALVIRRVGPDGAVIFLPAVSFLFLVGKVEYHLKNDTLEYRR